MAAVINFLEYEETLLYGKHSRDALGKFALQEASRARLRKHLVRESRFHRFSRLCSDKWVNLTKAQGLGKSLEDWMFLTLLGVSVAIFSFAIDIFIDRCHTGRLWLLELTRFSVLVQYIGWVTFYVTFACLAVGITHLIAPTAIGSGIPEMKTMIRGVVMPEYLTIRTLLAKIFGLTASLSSGLPVGKEGPFVHIAGIVAAVIAKHLPSFQSEYENRESRMANILSPACAVGVACTFAAPIGVLMVRFPAGLLFSIEATATYFAVHNYWRGFYAASCGTITFRLLAIWFHEEKTLTALERTSLPQEVPFHPLEMLMFALLGILCGLGGALFITINKSTVLFMRKQKKVKEFLQKSRFIYPSIIALFVSSCLFPPGLGQYMVGELTNQEALKELFSNLTWTDNDPMTYNDMHMVHRWAGPWKNVIFTTALFFAMRLWMSAISTTCPFPSGMIVPAFTLGAAFGRMFGESVAVLFPLGIGDNRIIPGGYALVGSAAFAGAVTQTYSTVVIVFELTGQIGHVLPCVIAVIISNLISRSLTPSVYDCIIMIKQLPFLPHTIKSDAVNAQQVFAEDIMVSKIDCLTLASTYASAQQMLMNFSYKAFPIVDSIDRMILVGSIHRRDLIHAVEQQLSLENKIKYFAKRIPRNASAPMLSPRPSLPITPQLSSPTASQVFVLPEDQIDGTQSSPAESTPEHPSKEKLARRTSSKKFIVKRLDSIQSNQDDATAAIGSNTPETGIKKVTDRLKSSFKRGRRERVHFKRSTTVDLHDPDKDKEWESHQMNQVIDLAECRYDPAPFQVVLKTTLYKIHSLFSLLSLHHTFVTNRGQLVGIISLAEVRSAIQGEVNKQVSCDIPPTAKVSPDVGSDSKSGSPRAS